MPQKTQYWENIALLIEYELQMGNPENWGQGQINTFLVLLEETVQRSCQNDPDKALRCGVPYIKGEYLTKHWRTIDSSTFRRIFKYGTSIGKTQTKQQFAIFLGFDSYEHFLIERGLGQEKKVPKSSNERISVKSDHINEFKATVLNRNFRWLILWLLSGTLMHNVFGIIK